MTDAPTGNLLFGGIDTAKFQGNLKRVKIELNPDRNLFDRLVIPLTSVKFEAPGTRPKAALDKVPVLLDSGSTKSYLSAKVVDQMKLSLNTTFDEALKENILPCDIGNSGTKITLQFGGVDGPILPLDIGQLALPLDKPAVFESGPNQGKQKCRLGVEERKAGARVQVIGDSILRSAYVVYDLANNEIAIAPTKFNATESKIVPFASMSAVIPSSTPVKS